MGQSLGHEAAAALDALGVPQRVQHRLLGGVNRRAEQRIQGVAGEARPDGLPAGSGRRGEGEEDVYVNRRAGATTGAWPGTQTFCGWKSSGSTGKGGLGPWYLPQFMREQSRTIVR